MNINASNTGTVDNDDLNYECGATGDISFVLGSELRMNKPTSVSVLFGEYSHE